MSAYFIIPDFFDTRIDKATYVEIVYELNKLGLNTKVLTSFTNKKYVNEKKLFYPIYFETIRIGWIRRIILIFNIFVYILKFAKKNDIIIVSPESLGFFYIAKIIKGIKLHLDIRTFPADYEDQRREKEQMDKRSFIIGIKGKLDRLLFFDLFLRLFFKKVDSYSFITEYMKNEFEKKYKLSPKTYCLWSSGVSTEIIKTKISKHKKYNNNTVFFYHGTISETRGIGIMYEAFKNLVSKRKDIKLLIVGDGYYLKTLKNKAVQDKLENRVILPGYVSYEEIIDYIETADICLCPLPNRIEWNVSSPIKIFEYMALGKPIVCTDIPAHSNVLKDMPFAVFTGVDIDSFEVGMMHALNTLETLNKYSDFEISIVNEYTWEKQAKVLYSYLEKEFNM